jgi:membrane-associated phospholipid phosphatase
VRRITADGPFTPHAPKSGRVCGPLPRLGIVIALGLFALLSGAVCFEGTPYFALDVSVSSAVQSAPWLMGFEPLMRGVSLLGDDVPFAAGLTVAACALLFVCKARREAVMLGLVTAAGYVVKAGCKYGIARPRPTPELVAVLTHPGDYSFPSGHTVHYVVFLGFLSFLTLVLVRQRLLRWPLLGASGLLIVLVGPSRVYLGAHWASDVLGGYLLGGVLLASAIYGYLWWTRRGGVGTARTQEWATFQSVAPPVVIQPVNAAQAG